jgi:hypothetical protein
VQRNTKRASDGRPDRLSGLSPGKPIRPAELEEACAQR